MEQPTATGISNCSPKFWIAPIELLAPRKSPEFERLKASRKVPPGIYQVRFYVDMSRKLSKNPRYRFKAEEVTAVMELTIGENDWPEETKHVKLRILKPQIMSQLKAKEIRYPGKALPNQRPVKRRRGG